MRAKIKPKYLIYIWLSGVFICTILGNIFIYYTIKNPPLNYALAACCFLVCFFSFIGVGKLILTKARKDLPS